MRDPLKYYIDEGFGKLYYYKCPHAAGGITGVLTGFLNRKAKFSINRGHMSLDGVDYFIDAAQFFLDYGEFTYDRFEAENCAKMFDDIKMADDVYFDLVEAPRLTE